MAFDASTGTVLRPELPSASVLVVSPNREMADAMELLLEEWGYRTEVASDPEQAADLTKTSRPSLILLDLTTTTAPYVERAARLASALTEGMLPVIALHDDDAHADRVSGPSVSAVRAPFHLDELEDLLMDLCASPASWLH